MSEFKGTQGKWKSYETFENQHTISTMDGRSLVVTTFNSNPHERKANVQLMSKSREMLQALKALVVGLKLDNCYSTETARDLKKAEQLIKEATEVNPNNYSYEQH